MKKIGLFALAGILILSLETSAQCRVGRPVAIHHTPIVHHTPVVHQVVKEVVVPVVAFPILPFSFQYQPPCYAPPAFPQVAFGQQQFQQQPGFQQQPYNQFQQQPGFQQQPYNQFQQQPGFQQQPLPSSQDKIRELARALLEEMSKQADDGGPPPVFDPNSPKPQQPQFPQPPQQNQEQLTYTALTALQRNCASCHTGQGSKGDFILFTQPGVVNQQASWNAVLKEITSQRMPPKSSQFRLTQDEFTAVNTWIQSFNR